MRSLFPDMCACHAEKAGEIGQHLTKPTLGVAKCLHGFDLREFSPRLSR
jgi:hypothetical protein